MSEVIVVEGWRDKQAVDRAVVADVVVTGGAALSSSLLAFLRRAQQERGVILLTDPDPMGERIRHRIASRVPGCKHAFLAPEDATDGQDIGIEYAAPEAIARALAAVRTEGKDRAWAISWEDMLQAGLVGTPDASARRALVAKRLNIGYANGKAFWKRINVLGVTRQEFWEAVDALDPGGGSHDGR
ncbi:MAG: ribonuclease M5 [Alicyclobacillaceae bacterium]|nr:ribonuclease M5 [Alicyclobacillaceae bacterium]